MEDVTERAGLKRDVEALIQAKFPGSIIEWEEATDLARPGGTVIWGGFADMTHVDRQRTLGDYLRAELGPRKRLLGLLFTLTPQELDFILQEA